MKIITEEHKTKANKDMEITFKEYADACEIINKFNGQCRKVRESRKAKQSDDIDVLLFEVRNDLADFYDFEKRGGSPLWHSPQNEIKTAIKKLLKRKYHDQTRSN